jgi:hypothetical protein
VEEKRVRDRNPFRTSRAPYRTRFMYRLCGGRDRPQVGKLRIKFRANDIEFDMVETLYGIGYRFKEV